ncbi:MAG: methyl-accepting chemotaxis protein [Granulosicoccus sp.]|jgi:methyl-accepting chemotaxis protein
MFHGLAAKFSIGVFVIVALLFSIYGTYDYQQMSERLYQGQKDTVTLVANSLSGTVSTALWNYESETIKSALQSNVNVPGITVIGVFDMEGKLFDAFRANAEGLPERVKDVEADNPSIQTYPLTYDDRVKVREVGNLFFIIDTSHIDKELSQLIFVALGRTLLFIILLVSIIVLLMNVLVSRPINIVVEALREISMGNGDLTKRLPETAVGEVGTLSCYFNKFVERIQNMVVDSASTNDDLAEAVEQLKYIVDKSSELVSTQQDETNMVATAVNEMSVTATEVASNANEAAEFTETANKEAAEATKMISKTVDVVESLANDFTNGTTSIASVQDRVNDIGSVLDVIRGIAEQTNLLALNAAIEAARAGEQGRGFAVVADEVRALAGRTQQSTGEIQTMIERLQASAGEAVKVMDGGTATSNNAVSMANDAVNSLSVISEHISSLNSMNAQTALAVGEQSQVSESVSENITRIASLANETNEVTLKALKISSSVESATNRLKAMIGSFKV